jgi:hypothetical protein
LRTIFKYIAGDAASVFGLDEQNYDWDMEIEEVLEVYENYNHLTRDSSWGPARASPAKVIVDVRMQRC